MPETNTSATRGTSTLIVSRTAEPSKTSATGALPPEMVRGSAASYTPNLEQIRRIFYGEILSSHMLALPLRTFSADVRPGATYIRLIAALLQVFSDEPAADTRATPKTGVSLQPALQRLVQLSGLAQDWDSYGGAPPSSQAISAARRLVIEVAEKFGGLSGELARPYAVVPIAGGGVQIEWAGPEAELEVEIGPDGSLSYLLVERRAGERKFEERERVSLTKIFETVGRAIAPRLNA